MRALPTTLLLAGTCLSALASPVRAGGPSYFLGTGATGTASCGFQGGWGLTAGVEVPLAAVASFLAQAEYQTVPDSPSGGIERAVTSATSLGQPAAGSRNAGLQAALMGFRLQAPHGAVRSYLDALVGVGHLRDHADVVSVPGSGGRLQVRDDTNVVLSLGTGARWAPSDAGGMFLDAHYQFYFVPGADTPIIPIRMGLFYP